MTSALRRTGLRALLAAMLACLGLFLFRLSDPSIQGPDDFVAYWAAGRVLAAGGNPYAPQEIMAVQQTAHWLAAIPYRIWYPPWAVALLVPMSMPTYQVARFVWFVMVFAGVIVASSLLWQVNGGRKELRPIAWVLPLTLWPVVIGWKTGQISALILFGVACFLFFERRGRGTIAGLLLVLASVKPQLLYLFWIAFFFWVIRYRRFDVAKGFAAGIVMLSACASALNPSVFAQFVDVTLRDPPYQAVSTFGSVLRLGVVRFGGGDHFWLLWAPCLPGLAWALRRWSMCRARWDWAEEAPRLVLVSVATSVWAWVYDETVFLIALLAAVAPNLSRDTAKRLRLVIVAYVLTNVALIAMNVSGADAFWYFWAPWAFLGLFEWYERARILPRRRAHRCLGDGQAMRGS